MTTGFPLSPMVETSLPARPRSTARSEGLHSGDGLGVRLHDPDPEDPDRLSLPGRLVGGSRRAETARGRCAAGPEPRRAARPRLATAPPHARPARPARRPGADVPAHGPCDARPDEGAPVSVPQATERERPAEAVAGFLAAAAIFVSLMGIAYRPVRLVPVAILLALVSAGIGGRSARLATFAVATGAASFAIGMAVAVLTGPPLY